MFHQEKTKENGFLALNNHVSSQMKVLYVSYVHVVACVFVSERWSKHEGKIERERERERERQREKREEREREREKERKIEREREGERERERERDGMKSVCVRRVGETAKD